VTFLLRLSARLPEGVRQRLRVLNRLRWITKARMLRQYGREGNATRLQRLLYVLWDPELDNFTYDLGNHDDLARFLAGACGVEIDAAREYIVEAEADDELHRRLAARLRRRWDKKSQPLYGRRLGWYALVRLRRPQLIVETGIHDGLGSAMLLRALERNEAEGAPGTLLSVDVDPAAGWLVDDRLRQRWEPVHESTFTALPRLLRGREVGMLIHDSDHTYDCELFEFTQAIEHRAGQVTLVSDNAHATSALRDVAAENGVDYRFFGEQPRSHFYPGGGIGLALLDAGRS
jgi:Methyltransferase domain